MGTRALVGKADRRPSATPDETPTLADYQTVAKRGDVPEGEGISVEVGGRMVALFLTDGAYFACDDSCPHQGAPLHDGVVADRSVSCAMHGWRFSLDDGRWIDSPRIKIPVYPVRVVGDEIQVAVDPV